MSPIYYKLKHQKVDLKYFMFLKYPALQQAIFCCLLYENLLKATPNIQEIALFAVLSPREATSFTYEANRGKRKGHEISLQYPGNWESSKGDQEKLGSFYIRYHR